MQIKIYNFDFLKDKGFSISKGSLLDSLCKIFSCGEIAVNVVFVDRETIKQLNKDHRGIDEITDVLAFGPYDNVGEVYIYPEFFDNRSSEFDRNIIRTIVHGILHVQGYDHEKYFDKDSLVEEMYILQEEYLQKIYDILVENNRDNI